MTTINPGYHTFGDANFTRNAYPGDAIQTEIDGITYPDLYDGVPE